MDAWIAHQWLCHTFFPAPCIHWPHLTLTRQINVVDQDLMFFWPQSLSPSIPHNRLQLDLPFCPFGKSLWQGRKEQNLSLGLPEQSQKIQLCTPDRLSVAINLYSSTEVYESMPITISWRWPFKYLKWWNKIQTQMQEGMHQDRMSF